MLHSIYSIYFPQQDDAFEGLHRVQMALGILVKYGVNLLKPMSSRPQGWAAVNFSNVVFRDKVDAMKVNFVTIAANSHPILYIRFRLTAS